MGGHGHFRELCKYCNAVIMQCRCIGPKETRYGVCADCQKKIAAGVPLFPADASESGAITFGRVGVELARARGLTTVQ
jgi:hypothetical protein